MSSGRASPALPAEELLDSASDLPRFRGLKKSSSINTLNGKNSQIRRSSSSQTRKVNITLQNNQEIY